MNANPLPSSPKFVLTATLVAFVVSATISLSFTFKVATVPVWSQLGISEKTGLENIKKSFIEGYIYAYGSSAAKKVALGDRAALTNELLAYCKTYIASPAFKKEYDLSREQSKPVPPRNPKTKTEIQAEQIAQLTKSIEETEKSIKTLPADLIASVQEVQQMLKDQIKDYEDPESEMLALLVEGEQYTYKNAMTSYEANVQTWETEYPENHMLMVKARLKKFLELTEGIDYNAALREQYGMKKFVNPVYESKPDEWKMAFRSGKPVVETARSFAKQWIGELE